MATCSDDHTHLPQADPNLEPEFRAVMGIIAFHSFLENQLCDRHPGQDLSKLQSSILIRLDRPKRLGELARDTGTLPSTMTTAADQMERIGLVIRERDPNDRRAWLLVLTDEGRALRREYTRMSRMLLQDLLQLDDGELEVLARIGTKLHTNIQLAIQNPELIEKLDQAPNEGSLT
ncbi:MarR family transcriptional regulator [Aliiroseovarius sp. KMU-50]|uniref:MarR family transcriptional regulator n=1 Tax=Aliiroseovarius salicola TaxID=3009082 RepID=A0ABT4VY01_9RHOB|nr:MarR family transcriptional regulator [Aliiroseovarius sp. KMU-50]MDA5093127.1 MarR family transcriptional regulator [Aliiroseovarius sp. KMU-50]